MAIRIMVPVINANGATKPHDLTDEQAETLLKMMTWVANGRKPENQVYKELELYFINNDPHSRIRIHTGHSEELKRFFEVDPMPGKMEEGSVLPEIKNFIQDLYYPKNLKAFANTIVINTASANLRTLALSMPEVVEQAEKRANDSLGIKNFDKLTNEQRKKLSETFSPETYQLLQSNFALGQDYNIFARSDNFISPKLINRRNYLDGKVNFIVEIYGVIYQMDEKYLPIFERAGYRAKKRELAELDDKIVKESQAKHNNFGEILADPKFFDNEAKRYHSVFQALMRRDILKATKASDKNYAVIHILINLLQDKQNVDIKPTADQFSFISKLFLETSQSKYNANNLKDLKQDTINGQLIKLMEQMVERNPALKENFNNTLAQAADNYAVSNFEARDKDHNKKSIPAFLGGMLGSLAGVVVNPFFQIYMSMKSGYKSDGFWGAVGGFFVGIALSAFSIFVEGMRKVFSPLTYSSWEDAGDKLNKDFGSSFTNKFIENMSGDHISVTFNYKEWSKAESDRVNRLKIASNQDQRTDFVEQLRTVTEDIRLSLPTDSFLKKAEKVGITEDMLSKYHSAANQVIAIPKFKDEKIRDEFNRYLNTEPFGTQSLKDFRARIETLKSESKSDVITKKLDGILNGLPADVKPKSALKGPKATVPEGPKVQPKVVRVNEEENETIRFERQSRNASFNFAGVADELNRIHRRKTASLSPSSSSSSSNNANSYTPSANEQLDNAGELLPPGEKPSTPEVVSANKKTPPANKI